MLYSWDGWLHLKLCLCSALDVASTDRNSPLSTSLASSESLSASLRSTELRNLQQLVETPLDETSSSSGANVAITGAPMEVGIGALSSAGASIIEGTRIQTLDLASSANTATSAGPSLANAINIVRGPSTSTAAAATAMPPNYEVVTAANISTAASASGHSLYLQHHHQQQPQHQSRESSAKLHKQQQQQYPQK